MIDNIQSYFFWINFLFKRRIPEHFKDNSQEYEIMLYLKNGWERMNSMELLNILSCKFGDQSYAAVEKFIGYFILKERLKFGVQKEGNKSGIEELISMLWNPLRERGFGFKVDVHHDKREPSGMYAEFCVKKCPVFELAEKTGMHKWLYHLVCTADYFFTMAFNPHIELIRTKTLMQGNDCCNHHYRMTD